MNKSSLNVITGELTVVEVTSEEIKATEDANKAFFDSLSYDIHRKNEYPSIEELTIALYDTDDKAAIETKRAAVKTKWPKDNSGPVE